MNEAFVFLLTTLISFWGSLQLGPVNVCVIQTAITRSRNQALMIAIGGSIPELFYASLAVWGANVIDRYPFFLEVFGWLVVLMLLGLGIYYFIKKTTVTQPVSSRGSGFAKGLLLASFNPQLLPFWLGVLVFLKNYIDFESGSLVSPYFAFVLGTAFGAFLLLSLFIKLAIRYRDKLMKILGHKLDKVVGSLFILLALIELVRRLLLIYNP